jgi:hypothetical protein
MDKRMKRKSIFPFSLFPLFAVSPFLRGAVFHFALKSSLEKLIAHEPREEE